MLCLLGFLFVKFAAAQDEQYTFSQLDIYKGLSHNQVNTILKDPKGFIWIGTMSGLNRYDGYSLKVFRSRLQDSTSLHDNFVSNLYELPEGKMWVDTRSGPAIYHARTEKFERNYHAYLQSLALPKGTTLSVSPGSNNRYWFHYDTLGLFTYLPGTKKAAPLHRVNNRPFSSRLASAREDGRGGLWLVYRDGLIEKMDAATGKVVFSSKALQQARRGSYPYSFYLDRSGSLWLWTAGEPAGAFVFDPAKNTLIHFNESSARYRLNNNIVTGIVEDDRGLVWVATDHGGVNLIDTRKGYTTQYLVADPLNPKGISQNSITTLYKDKTGIIWLGTYKQGVNYLDENVVKFAHYRHHSDRPASLPYDDVNRFVEDKKGNLWIGTNGGGLIYFDRARNSFRRYLHDPANPNSLSNNVVVSLCIDHEDKLWIGTFYGGLSSFDGRNFVHYKHDPANEASLADDRVWEIFEDGDLNLWVGTLNGGLDLLDRKNGRFTHRRYREGVPSPLQSNYISSIIRDRQQNLWVGTALGLSVFAKGKTEPLYYFHSGQPGGLSNNNVISLLEDSRGRVWVGTREGLNLFRPRDKKFDAFTTQDGLPDNTVLNIVEDKAGHLWISTPNGLCKVLVGVEEGVVTISTINYDETNNLQGREFNDNAALRLRSGELVFGGPEGFNIIDPSRSGKASSKPVIVFTGLQILNNTVEPGEEINGRVLLEQALPETGAIRLKYKENVFSVEFAALDFSHGTRDKYAYMLEGFNSDWLYTDALQRKVTYTNLNPGAYLLRVKTLNNSGVWSGEKTLRIVVAPPFWLTPWAFALYVAIILGILWVARKITVERAHMRFEVQQQRREAERVQALDRMKTKFFTNVSHEFRTPLSLILSPLDTIIKKTGDADQKKQLQLVHRNAKRLLNLVNQLLDFRKMEVQQFKLYPMAGDVVAFIKDISYSFSDISEKKHIAFSFDSSVESLDIYFDKDKLEKILFNLLSNAYKYTPENGKVAVQLDYRPGTGDERNGEVVIKVSDTGIGIPADKHDRIFERFFQDDVPASMVNQGSGIGLAITREFVKLHSGTISVESAEGQGSCFTVVLPAVKYAEKLEGQAAAEPVGPDGGGQPPAENAGKGARKTILLVEDNEDFRFYLKDNLAAQYQVVEAVNGKEGWQKVKEVLPDLVVSDIMMPELNGIELTRKIKGDPLTALIPIVLLTAVGNEEMQLEGFDAGVSDYITKPFTFEILASRITNLLAQQAQLRKKLHKQMEVAPGEVAVTSADEQFLKKALAVVEKNIGDPDFSVEEFSRQMFMSRVALYKKILALTGKAPLEFIRTVRLKRGAQLLEKSQMTIAEIAFEVGFNNPKNFSKYFKEEFKMLPSMYQAEKKKEGSSSPHAPFSV